MIEAIFEGFFSTLGEILAYSLWPLLYFTGWLFLKMVTLGSYPPKHDPMAFGPKQHSEVFVRSIGFCIWVVIAYFVYIYVL